MTVVIRYFGGVKLGKRGFNRWRKRAGQGFRICLGGYEAAGKIVLIS